MGPKFKFFRTQTQNQTLYVLCFALSHWARGVIAPLPPSPSITPSLLYILYYKLGFRFSKFVTKNLLMRLF